VRRRRILKRVGLAAGGLVGLLALTVLASTVVLQGERLASVVKGSLPAMRGKIEFRAAHWHARALTDLLTDRPTPLTVEGLRITDPEGTVVLEAPRLEVKVRPRSALAGKIYLHDLVLGPGSLWRFAALKKSEGNGFLSSFAPAGETAAPPPPPPAPGEPVADPFTFQIVNAQVDGLTAVFDFPAWGLELRNLKGPVWLTVDGRFVGWDGTGLDARSGGFLRIIDEVLPFDRVLVNRVATTREWPDSIFLDVGAARTGRSTLTAKGYFTEIYGYGYDREPDAGIDLHGEISDAADALNAVAARHAIPGLRIGGKGQVVLDLKQPFARMKIAAILSGLDVAFGDYRANALSLKASVVTDPLHVALDQLDFSAPGGGRMVLGADLLGTAVKAKVKFERFSTASYVPAPLKRLAAGKLNGRFALAGDFGEKKRLTVGPIDLTLTRTKTRGLPGTVRIKGEASSVGQRLTIPDIAIDVPGASARLRGEVQLAKQMFSLGLRASTSDLPSLLTSLGMQPLARGAAISVEADGTFKQPRARGEVVVQGIGVPGLPEVPRLLTRFRFEDGSLHVDSLSGQAFGGEFQGSGQVKLFEGSLDRMLRSPLITFQLQGKEVELANLLALGWASGKVSFVARADGPLDKLRAHVEIPAGATLQIFGLPWQLGGIDVEADARSVVVRTAKLGRPSGAQVELEGRMEFGGPMAWRVVVRDVALDGLPGLAASGVPLSGKLSADLAATGTLARPMLNGTISLRGVSVRGTRLGDGQLALTALGDTGVRISGNLFRRLEVEASAIHGNAGTRVLGAVSFNRLALEDLLPELRDLGDGKGLATGRITVDFRPDAPLMVDAKLSELQVSITREAVDKDGKAVPQLIWVKNAGDLHLAMIGERVVLDQARLVTDGGEFRLSGELAGQTVRGSVAGHLTLDLLQPFLRHQVERLAGDLAVDLKVSGTTSRPDLQGRVAIAHPVRVQLVGTTPEVVIPSGAVTLTGQSIKLNNLAITVDQSTLTLQGEARHDERFNPTSFQLDAAGEVSAKLLETLASSAISDATGVARVRARLSGTPAAPAINARIDLGLMEMRLRSVGRVISLESGTVELTSKELVLRDVKTRIDEQGRLLIGAAGVRPGRIAIKSLVPLELGRIDLPLKGERLTYRVPNSVEIDDLGFDLALTGDLENGLGLAGQVLVMSGRYVQDFQVQDLVLSPRIRESSTRPFYEGNPTLADLGLNLRVRTVGDSFLVQNNLAPEIHVLMDLRVSGTLSEPRLAGTVRPTDGRFRILGIRGEFELTPNVNHITFVETKSISAGETPELNLEALNRVPDSSGVVHDVRMRIRGPIGQAAIELSTEDGRMDRGQAALLLVSGRTTDDATRFNSTANPTLGSNFRTGTDMVGQITRDTVGNLVEPYIDDTLQLLTGRKINLRPTVGVDGFELRLLARASRNTDLQLSFLRGFQNQQRYRGDASLWLMDYVSARGFFQRLTLSPQQGISEDDQSFNLELGFDFPLRLGRP
jgi:autotransporter translocation and assembly factor TamB